MTTKKPTKTAPATPAHRLLGSERFAEITSWAEDNLDATKEIRPADNDECWRVVFAKKAKILSAAEKADLANAMRVVLRQVHADLGAGAKLDGAKPTEPAADKSPALPPPHVPPLPRHSEQYGKYEAHPAAAKFPTMVEDELIELGKDIRDRGQRHKCVVSGNVLLDGRNRWRACELMGIEPEIEEWNGQGGSEIAFVISLNLQRRHLDSEQRKLLGAELLPMFEEEAAARRLANLRKGDVVPIAPNGAIGESHAAKELQGKASEMAARAVGESPRSIERAKVVLDRGTPEELEKVRSGRMSISAAERKIRKREAGDNVRKHHPIDGTFNVLIADPPWPFDLREDDETHRNRMDYPPMTIEEIRAFKVPAADDCILFMWCPKQHLLDGTAQSVVAAWGFEAKNIWDWVKVSKEGKVWAKSGHYGRNAAEHIIVAIRGKPVYDFDAQPTTFLAVPPREHSRKPPMLHEIVERCCPAPAKCELFARESRAGWVTSGSDAEKFDDISQRRARSGARATHAGAQDG